MADTYKDSLLNYVATTTDQNLTKLIEFTFDASNRSGKTLVDVIQATGARLIFAGDGHIFTHGVDLLSSLNLLKKIVLMTSGGVPDPNKVLISNDNGKIVTSTITKAQLETLQGINTSTTIQSQLDALTTGISAGMHFKGAVNTDADITSNLSSGNIGDTYRVGTNGLTISNVSVGSPTNIKVGDTIIIVEELQDPSLAESATNTKIKKWVVIPSGDDIEDSWRKIYYGDSASELLGNSNTGKGLLFKAGSGLGVTGNNSGTYGEISYSLTLAGNNTIGGIKLGYSADVSNKKYPLEVDTDGKAYVQVNWSDANTWRSVYVNNTSFLNNTASSDDTKQLNFINGLGIDATTVAADATNKYANILFNLKKATDSVLGGITICTSSNAHGYNVSNTISNNYATSATEVLSTPYGVQIDANGVAFVNVPWVKYGTAVVSGVTTVPTIDGTTVTGSQGLITPEEKYNLYTLVKDSISGDLNTWRKIKVNGTLQADYNAKVINGVPARDLDFVSTESGILANCRTTSQGDLQVGFSLAWYNISTSSFELATSDNNITSGPTNGPLTDIPTT